MTPNLSPDARAVVRAAEALTTQVRRIADALTTPVVEQTDATGDAPTTPATTCSAQYTGTHPTRWCIRAAHHAGKDHVDEVGFHWPDTVAVYPTDPGVEHESGDASCRIMETRTCPPSYNGPCGDRPCARFESDDPTPWLDAAEAPAADEDTQRAERRKRLDNLTARGYRGVLTHLEIAALRNLIDAEIREADTARTVAARNKRHVRVMHEELDKLADEHKAADRIRAEVQRDRDQHAAVLGEVLATFVHEVRGLRLPSFRSGPVDVVTLDKWRSVVAPTMERPWWQTVAEVRAELEAARAAIERVRERCQSVRDRIGPGGMINATQILGLLSPTWPDGNYEAPAPGAALDGAEQPTTGD